ncbi:MAG TPA: sugar phosphate isomerase/epimerase [Bryobacteraceae bacterium]|nr:sugar phosphate isomerase/epimerase [Bryobacteraceae bacterium]
MVNLSRREFLAAVPAFALAAPRKPVVAGHPWVYAATLPEYDVTPALPQVFTDMKWAGLDAIELMHTALRPADAVERIAELSGKHKLPVLGMSFSAEMWNRETHPAILDDANLLIPRLTKLGGRTLGISVGTPQGRRKTPAEFDAQAEILRRIIAVCKANRVVLNLHNHTYEVADGEFDLNGTLERVPEAKLGPDIAWLHRAKVDPIDFIRRRGRRMVFAHLRDDKADGTWPEAMGEGIMDYAAIARALREAGFAGDVAIELAHPRGFKPTRPLRESLKISRDYVRRTMGW